MTFEEFNERSKTATITYEQVMQLSTIYCMLDFHKDDFVKLVDAIGLDKWLGKVNRFKRLDRAEQELAKRERYETARRRLVELEYEREALEAIIEACELV